jgi:glucuronate isomerase
LSGAQITTEETESYATFILLYLGRLDAAAGWTKQLHLGAIRDNNRRLCGIIGENGGFDSIGDFPQARNLSAYLNELDASDELPRVVLYNLNPADNYVFSTMCGNFAADGIAGKMQYGSAWWFLDQKDGMEAQINTLSQVGLLSQFVGMLTDSRSFLSYVRHEYFRRILCNLIGRDVEQGLIPADEAALGKLVRDICFDNAAGFFGLEMGTID